MRQPTQTGRHALTREERHERTARALASAADRAALIAARPCSTTRCASTWTWLVKSPAVMEAVASTVRTWPKSPTPP